MHRGNQTSTRPPGSTVGRFAVWTAAVLLMAAVPSTASAAVMTYMDIEDLVEDSDRIVHGEVEKRRTFRDDARGKVFTHTTIDVTETYLGDEQSSVTIEQFGGTYREQTHTIPGDAEFEEGEEVVVFLAENRGPSDSPHYLVGLAQSKFTVFGGDDHDKRLVRRELSGLALRAKDGARDGELAGLGRQTWTFPSFEAELEALVYAKENGEFGSSNAGGSTNE